MRGEEIRRKRKRRRKKKRRRVSFPDLFFQSQLL